MIYPIATKNAYPFIILRNSYTFETESSVKCERPCLILPVINNQHFLYHNYTLS